MALPEAEFNMNSEYQSTKSPPTTQKTTTSPNNSYPFSSPPPPLQSTFNSEPTSMLQFNHQSPPPPQFNHQQPQEFNQQPQQFYQQPQQPQQFNHQQPQQPQPQQPQPQQPQFNQQPKPNPSLPMGNWQDALSNPQMSQRFQEWKILLLKGIRPWIDDFFNLQQISLPTQSSHNTDFLPMTTDSQAAPGFAGTDPSIPLIIRKRLEHNVKYYKCNYLIISFIISLYTFVQNILLFFFIIVLSLGWTISIGLPKLWNQEIGGMVVQRTHLLGAMLVISILFVISNLNTLLWWAFLTFLSIVCHGSLHNIVHSTL